MQLIQLDAQAAGAARKVRPRRRNISSGNENKSCLRCQQKYRLRRENGTSEKGGGLSESNGENERHPGKMLAQISDSDYRQGWREAKAAQFSTETGRSEQELCGFSMGGGGGEP